jgi:hypothetical protein
MILFVRIKPDPACLVDSLFLMLRYGCCDATIGGVLTAIHIHKSLAQMEMTCGIGITTGDCYCGSVGSQQRCEYAIVGDVVNLWYVFLFYLIHPLSFTMACLVYV